MFQARPIILARQVVPTLALLSLVLWGASARADYDDPPSRVARLAQVQGQVSIEPSGVDQWSQATSNYPVATGDRVYADQDGRSEISAGDVVARVGHSTDVTMTNLTDQIMQLGLAQGTLRIHAYSLGHGEQNGEGQNGGSQVEIDTPNGAITISQPSDIRIDTYSGDDGTYVTVNSGAVQISGPNLQQDVYAGQSIHLQGSNPIEVSQAEMPGQDEFDSWCLDRDRHMRNSQSARYVNRDAIGADDLDDYGSWSQDSQYGPVWYPQQVSADWAPYREGHWVWTGPWGWTWVEDEPWGYAPFHYGRWVQVHDRWGWMPGPVDVRPVWSPALVAFVGGGGFSVGVSAWFPLGPAEPYRPWYHCSPAYQQRVNVTNVNITVIHNTTIINNYNVYMRNPQDASHINSVNYVNKQVAVTAMRHDDFASARSARGNMVRVDPRQLQQAQVVAHAEVRPTQVSIAPHPVRAVPVSVQRPTLLTQGGREMRAEPGARPQPVPVKALPPTMVRGNAPGLQGPRTASPVVQGNQNPRLTDPRMPNSRTPGVQNPPVLSNSGGPGGRPAISRGNNGSVPVVQQPARPLPPVNTGRPSYAPPTPQPALSRPENGRPMAPPAHPQQPLINRNETPAPKPTFQQQQPALNQHPGRPLEPQQLDNLHQGRPAGPPRDVEALPHAQPQPKSYQPPPQAERPTSQPPPRQSPAPQQPQARGPQAKQPEARPAPKDKDKDKKPQ